MGHCTSQYLMPCVKTEKENINHSQSYCQVCSIFDLMEESRFTEEDAVKKISLLVKMGADINARERKTGNSLLHIAVNKRNYELVKWLCQESSVIGGAINYMLQTPYHLAYHAHDQQMMDFLRTNGATCDDPVTDDMSDDESNVSID